MAGPLNLATALDVAKPPKEADAEISLDFVASAALELPGLRASIDKVGAKLLFDLKLDRKETGGLIDCRLEFREPSGMSAELLLPGASGGGYLRKEGQQLRGAFAANLGVISVQGLGVLELERYSMLVLLAAEFETPLQLSFGFTLVGVGGLVGINRRCDQDQLSAAMSSGDLSAMLFPRDPVAEAPHLLDAMNRCFPPEEGGVLIGPMVKVGWGTPTLLSATVAVIVSTADEGVLIIGRLAIKLPFEDAPLISLEALVSGKFDKNGVAIDASLVNSRICGISVEGDLRLRMLTAPSPLFALAAGGFHPSFAPPDGMAGMRRISMDLSPGAILHLRLEAYMAVTTNAVQFGAHVELSVGVDGFGIHGFAGYDALIVFDPFGFTVGLYASVSIECADFDVASINLSGELSGPTPWRIRGRASIELLFLEIDVEIPDTSWGPPPAEEALVREPLEVIEQALAVSENWMASAVPVLEVAILRSGTEGTAVHPLGAVGFRQRAIPLEEPLQRCDGGALRKPTQLHIKFSEGESTAPLKVERMKRLEDDFIPSQFFDLDENDRHTKAAYRRLLSGYEILPQHNFKIPKPAIRDCDYEVKELSRDELSLGTVALKIKLSSLAAEQSQLKGVLTRKALDDKSLIKAKNPHQQKAAPEGFTDAAGIPMEFALEWEI